MLATPQNSQWLLLIFFFPFSHLQTALKRKCFSCLASRGLLRRLQLLRIRRFPEQSLCQDWGYTDEAGDVVPPRRHTKGPRHMERGWSSRAVPRRCLRCRW